MNYTQIKRLFLNNAEFVPITLAEAVVVNTSTIPGLVNLGITTLDKVLKNTLGLIGNNATNITTLGDNLGILTGVVLQINTELQNKQDKLTAGVGITITQQDDKVIISASHSIELYKIITAEIWNQIKLTPEQLYENTVYLVPTANGTNMNIFREYLCVFKENNYLWEELGTIQTDIDLSGYVTTETFQTLVNNVNDIRATGIFAQNVVTSTNQQVVVQYIIPNTLYDSAVNIDGSDLIIETNTP